VVIHYLLRFKAAYFLIIMSDILSNFNCLDELTQVIYQGIYKFVVLSNVSNEEWSIHVGLAGREGRWWRGCWKEDDIHHFFVRFNTCYRLNSDSVQFLLNRGQNCQINSLKRLRRNWKESSFKANYVSAIGMWTKVRISRWAYFAKF